MKKFNLVGNTFTHLTGGNKGYSVHGKVSKYIEWVPSGAEDTFYIDHYYGEAYADDRPGKKYLWLLESKWISPAIAAIKQAPETIDRFDLVFTHDKEIIALNPEKCVFVPAQGSWIQDKGLHYDQKRFRGILDYSTPRVISMIASNKDWTEGHKKRLAWRDKFAGQVDFYGRGINEIARKETGLVPYMFSIAIENGSYETYFTEKILDCFLTGTIPVYYGAPDIGDYFNMDGIILLTDDWHPGWCFYDLYMLMKNSGAIEDNFERALKMEVLEDYIYLNYLQ